MATTDFVPFAAQPGANVLAQADYAAAGATATGFQAGLASSAAANKALRQGTFGAATLFNFVIGQTAVSANDDGNVSGAVTNLTNALTNLINATAGHLYSYAGNPNGNVAGVAGAAGVSPADMCVNTLTGQLYVCTTSGNAAGAVWTLGSAGGVTSVTAGTGLDVGAGPGGSITTTGTLNLKTATTTVLGGVKVDGTTITISGGVISSANAGGNVVGPSPTVVGDFAVFNNTSGTLLKDVPAASAAQIWAATDNGSPITALGLKNAHAFPASPLTDAATVNWNMATQGLNQSVTLGGNRTIAAPSNVPDGRPFCLLIKQPATGGPFVPALNAFFNFQSLGAPSFSTNANAVDMITGIYISGLGYANCAFLRGA